MEPPCKAVEEAGPPGQPEDADALAAAGALANVGAAGSAGNQAEGQPMAAGHAAAPGQPHDQLVSDIAFDSNVGADGAGEANVGELQRQKMLSIFM